MFLKIKFQLKGVYIKVLNTLLACLLTFSCAFAAHKKPLKASPVKELSYGLAEYTNPSRTIDNDIVIPVEKNKSLALSNGVVMYQYLAHPTHSCATEPSNTL